MSQRLLVTSALPYANGSIHLGHLVEYIQTDVYVRFRKACGDDVTYVCAADSHGTPIEVNAAKAGVSPKAFVERWRAEQHDDFKRFGVEFATYYTTDSEENKKWAYRIYDALKAKGLVYKKSVEQLYCETDRRFLPDRFVKGTCPKCGTPDQYGDVCESCGTTYDPRELVGPACAICGNPPVVRTSDHAYVNLRKPEVAGLIRAWVDLSAVDPGEHTLPVQVQVDSNLARKTRQDPEQVTLTLEKVLTQTLPIKLMVSGEAPLGYEVQTPRLEPQQVTVSGPTSLISRVREVRAQLDLSGVTQTITRTLTLAPVDSTGKSISGVSVLPASARVIQPVTLLGGYRNVIVKLVTTGIVASGYRLSNYFVSPSSVVVFSSDPKLVENLPGYVETEPLDLTNATDDFESLYVGIILIGTNVNYIRTFGRNHVMLRSCIDNGYRHLNRPEQLRFFRKLVCAEPVNIVDGKVKGINPFVACCMTCFPDSFAVENHQSFRGNSHLHLRWFSHNGKVNFAQLGNNTFHSTFSGYFFFGGSTENEVKGPFLLGREMHKRH